MKTEITEQQIVEMAKAIGERPAFPHVITKGWELACSGITYRQWLIGQVISHPDGNTDRVEYVLRDLAKAELEAEQEVGNV